MHTPEKGKFEEDWKNAFDGAELTPSKGIWNSIDFRLSQVERASGGFEKGWEKAFGNAELEPSEGVWKAIDVALVQAENITIKKRVVFYQRLAAASVGIMIMFGTYSWFSPDGSATDLISEAKNVAKDEITAPPSDSGKEKIESNLNSELNSSSNSAQNSSEVKASGSNESPVRSKIIESKSRSSQISRNQEPAIASFNSESVSQTAVVALATEGDVSNLHRSAQSLTGNRVEKGNYRYNGGPISTVEALALTGLPDFFGPNDYAIAYRLADARPAVLSQKKGVFNKENQWASVGFSAGSFYPGIGGGEVTENLKSIRAAQVAPGFATSDIKPTTTKQERIKSGTSMAMALSGGKRLFKKWILQGGVTYLNQTSTTESEVVSVAQANQVQDEKSGGYSLESTNTVTYDERQNINTNFQFVSVPLQLGYMVLDKKIGVQINGGLAPDFLLKNTVYNEATRVETTNSASTSGNLNTVSVSGMGGLEVSYRFLNHYRLSLVPGVKYSLTPVYSDNSLASAKPFMADIGLRFRYIF